MTFASSVHKYTFRAKRKTAAVTQKEKCGGKLPGEFFI
jgi:hypothetical protein